MSYRDSNSKEATLKEYSLFILGDFWDLWRKHDIIYSTESDEILSLVNQFKTYIISLVTMTTLH